MKNILLHLIRAFLVIALLFTNSITSKAQLSGTKTVGSGGNYSTLTAAITAVSSAGVNGPLVLELQSNYTSATETFPLTFGLISGVSAINTITVRPASGALGLSITSPNVNATIDFSGSKYVIIDGRPGGTTALLSVTNTTLLSIINTSTSGVTIRMQNDALYNTIKFCDLQGVNATSGQVPGSQAGVVFIGTTSGSTGNDFNVIDFCNIHPTSNTLISTMGVYSFGPSGSTSITAAFNDSNTISNCNIFDMYGGSNLTTAGIECEKGTNAWFILNNSFFQTTSRSPTLTAAVANRGIYLATTNSGGVGNGFTVVGNYIGGMAPRCGGSAWTTNPTGSFNNLFDGITLTVAGGNASNVKSNVIANLNISQGAVSNDLFHGIWCQNAGNVNVGGPLQSDGNLVGSTTATGSITLYSAGSGSAITHNPIYVASGTSTPSTFILFKNNAVGGINLTGPGDGFSGIFVNGTAPTVVIDHNLIGSLTVRNSINASDPSATAVRFMCGIRSPSGSATLTIDNNVIANLNNNSTSTTATSGISNASVSTTAGIIVTGASTATQIVNSISGNIVKNLSCAAYQTSNYVNTVLCGIGTNAAGGNPTNIMNNLVDSLVSTSASSATSQNILMAGIFYYSIGTTSVTIIANNTVHSFDMAVNNPGATWRGIEVIGGPVGIANNMIRLGIKPDGTSYTPSNILYGLITESTSPHYVYHNSVYVGGTGVTGSAQSVAYHRYNAGTDDIRNNIFVNNRSNASGATGKHYTTILTNTNTLTLNNNIYYGNGTGWVFGTTNGGSTDVLAYSSGWVTGDANSYTNNGGFINDTGMASTVNLHIKSPLYKGESTAIIPVPTDLDGEKRSVYPDIGADEIPWDLGVVAIDSPTTVSFCGTNKNIWARIKNYGLQTITAASIVVTVNGTYAYSYNWSGNLLPGSTSAQINVGSYNFSGGNYKLELSTALTSGYIDNSSANDTAAVLFSVTPTVVPSITVTTPLTTVCTGSSVTFKSTFNGGGSAPVLQWKLNSTNIGTGDTSYTTSSLANNDTIWCTITSNAACANPTTVVSAKRIMKVSSSIVPSVSIASVDTNICSGKSSSFTVTAVNGGLTPHYQWRRNSSNVGTDSIGYKLLNPSNKDTITCVLMSSLACASKPADTSKAIILTVNPLLTPLVTISATSTAFCSGLNDTFTAVTTNSGTFPSYSWRLTSGQIVGSNSNKFISSTLKDKDTVYLVLVSNEACLATPTGTSNKIGLTVFPVVTPSVSLTASKTTLCSGELIDFKVSTLNGGNTPVKQWYKNSTLLAPSIDSIQLSTLNDKDTIYFKLTSSASCVTPSPIALSNKIVVSVNAFVTPTVTASASSTSICSGTNVLFTAKGTNTGTTPHYIWKKNGVIVGNDDTVYSSSLIANKDTILVVLKGSAICQTKTGDTSAKIIMNVTPSVTPAITVTTPTTSVCRSAATHFTASIVSGGTTPHYKWVKNGIQVGTDSTALILSTIDNRDTVYAFLTSNATCATATQVQSNKLIMLSMADIPASVSISENANSVCSGTSVTFFTTPINGGLTPVFQWMRNGKPVGNGALNYTTDSLSDNDTIMLKMYSTVQCAVPAIANSNIVRMKVIKRETPEVSVKGEKEVACAGDVIVFTATDSLPLSIKSHQWFRNGAMVGSDTTVYSTAVNIGDKIKCVLYAKAACYTKPSDTGNAVLTVSQVPIKPSLSRRADTLHCSVSASAYQWFLNNNPISGATQQDHKMLQNGSYKVTITNNNCSNSSDTFGYYHVSVANVNALEAVQLWPNPAAQSITIKGKYEELAETIIQVFDISGKLMFTLHENRSNEISKQISLEALNSGAYMVNIIHGEQHYTRKLLKE